MTRSIIRTMTLTLLLVIAGLVAVRAQDNTSGLKVIYHGTETTFEALEERGIITHCMDDIANPGAGIVLCFDSREERNAIPEKLRKATVQQHSD